MKTAMPENHWYLGNLPRQIHLWAHEWRISTLLVTIMPEMPQNPQNLIFCGLMKRTQYDIILLCVPYTFAIDNAGGRIP